MEAIGQAEDSGNRQNGQDAWCPGEWEKPNLVLRDQALPFLFVFNSSFIEWVEEKAIFHSWERLWTLLIVT